MAAKKVGVLIREARSAAGLTQEQLAQRIPGLSASDISKAERGEKELTQAQLKDIARATGVTQSSLLNAPKGGVASSAKKTEKPSASSTKPSSTQPKPASSSSAQTVKVTAAEKRMLQLYRGANANTRSAVMRLLENGGDVVGSNILDVLNAALDALSGRR